MELRLSLQRIINGNANKFILGKWQSPLALMGFVLFFSNVLLAQSTYPQTMKGKVSFEKDSTDWIAVVIQKDTVSAVFKLTFDVLPNHTAPSSGVYEVVYMPDVVQFNSTKNANRYAFTKKNVLVKQKNYNVQQWHVKDLKLINPASFSWIELKK